MKTAVVNAFLGLAALTLAACATPEKTTDPSTGADLTKPAAAAETAGIIAGSTLSRQKNKVLGPS